MTDNNLRNTISISQGILANPAFAMSTPVNLCIRSGEQIAIIGPNGSGKTRLVDVLTGRLRLKGNSIEYDIPVSQCDVSYNRYVSDEIKYIAFKDSYGTSDANYYYQQRWNHIDIDPEFTPTVRKILEDYLDSSVSTYMMSLRFSSDSPSESTVRDSLSKRMYALVEQFSLMAMLDKYVITLSSGELRKLQLVKQLVTTPSVLIIDNPYLGLDEDARQQLSEVLTLLTKQGLQVILVLSRYSEIPDFITHIIPVEAMSVGGKIPWNHTRRIEKRVPNISPVSGDMLSPEVIKFNSVSIRYDSRTILDSLDWTVRQGEHWALMGMNGCGKSTLLSLVCADNPKAYACDIELFGRKRGTGESIWDIKRNIGYVSPEMHRSYNKDLPVKDIVASGFFDTVGLFCHPSEEQISHALELMREFAIDGIAEKSFLKVSSGEQRLALLARAFVKNPALLILDEPMHGLDQWTVERVRVFIDSYFKKYPSKTLIMVTHYEDELPACIDHRLVLKRH